MTSDIWAVSLGLLLGALGGGLHLAVTWQRARAVCAGRAVLALSLLPVAFMGPIGAVLLSLHCCKLAAWATVPGLIAVRSCILPRSAGARDAQ